MIAALRVLAGVIVTVIVVLVNAVIVMYMERKVLGHLQMRLGPMRTGFHGVLQPIADAIKLLAKEDLVPAGADRILFLIAPVMAFVPALLLYAAMPWVSLFTGVDLDVGIFYFLGVSALVPVALVVAGWASNSKYSLLGGFRAAAQQISYEVPMILAVLGVVMLAASMRLAGIVAAQSSVFTWNVVLQPLAFVLFIICVLAEVNRVPFDLSDAESELISGVSTEYSAMRFALFFLSEYMNVFTYSLLGALLFLGGWNGPLLPAIVWLALKTYVLVFCLIWVRCTLPRVRVDQLMEFGWKVLLPAAMVNLLLVVLGVVTNLVVLFVAEVAALAGFIWLVRRIATRPKSEPLDSGLPGEATP